MSSGLIPQGWLEVSGLTELQFILALAGAALFICCVCTVCCPCFNQELAKIDPGKKWPITYPSPDCYFIEAAPAAEEAPASEAKATPVSAPKTDTVIDVHQDCVISINGRPVDAQRRGIALPYTPNRSLIVTSAAPVGAVQVPGPDETQYAPEVVFARSARSSNAGGGAYKANDGGDDGTWEADRMSSLEHRVRSLESQLAVARAGGHGKQSATVAAANAGSSQAGSRIENVTVFKVQ
jgi:hypothetical protein